MAFFIDSELKELMAKASCIAESKASNKAPMMEVCHKQFYIDDIQASILAQKELLDNLLSTCVPQAAHDMVKGFIKEHGILSMETTDTQFQWSTLEKATLLWVKSENTDNKL